MGSGDSIPLLGDSQYDRSVLNSAGSLSKREGGYIHPASGSGSGAEPQCIQIYSPTIRAHLTATDVETSPTGTGVKSLSLPVCPGFDIDVSKFTCGDIRSRVVCPKVPDHYKRVIKFRCFNSGCPVCWPAWAGRARDRASSRIEGYRSAAGIGYLPRHISLSPPPDAIPYTEPSEDALKWLLNAANRHARTLGVKAAAAIPHPYRLVPEQKKFIQEQVESTGKNRYLWSLSQSNWSDYLYFSPHVHLETYGYLMDSEKFSEMTGWIYNNHDDDGDDGFKGRLGDELKRTLYYLLTHAWCCGRSKIIRYWFGMSPRRLACQVDKNKTPENCPKCNTQTVRLPPDSKREIPGRPGEYQNVPFYEDLNLAPKAYWVDEIRTYSFRHLKKYRRKPKVGK